MAWRDLLRTASFRGIQFKVKDSDMLFGRRGETHEYPYRDSPYSEDLGRKAREISINAYIIGDNYTFQRDALIAAIEENGTAGTLIHPTLGTLTVVPKECHVTFDKDQGGVEFFSLTFMESGQNQYPSSLVNTSAIVSALSTSTAATFLTNFSSKFQLLGFPDFLANTAQSQGQGFLSNIKSILQVTAPAGGFFSSFTTLLGSFDSNTLSNVLDGTQFGSETSSVVKSFSSSYSAPAQAYTAQRQLVQVQNNANLTSNYTTPSRTQETNNSVAYKNLVTGTALAEMANLAAVIKYPSRDEAIATRDQLSGLLSDQILIHADAGNDELYNALRALRAAVIKDLNTRGAQLTKIITIKTLDSMPALCLAYAQYEDAERAEEIITRNHISHPLFTPANSELELLQA